MPNLTDFLALFSAAGVAFAGVVRIATWFSRHRKQTVDQRFQSIDLVIKQKDAVLDNCQAECKQCRTELQVEKNFRARDKEWFFQQITSMQQRVSDCEGMMRRAGVHDDRKRSAPFSRERRRRFGNGGNHPPGGDSA